MPHGGGGGGGGGGKGHWSMDNSPTPPQVGGRADRCIMGSGAAVVLGAASPTRISAWGVSGSSSPTTW